MSKLIIVAALATLVGCSEQALTDTGMKEPDIYLEPGIKLKVGNSESANIFGYDACPVELNEVGCLKLSPDTSSVDVRLILESGVVAIENWSVGIEGHGYLMTRPNGFVVQQFLVDEK